MEFITLSDLLSAIAPNASSSTPPAGVDSATPTTHGETEAYSEAATRLHEALHNHPTEAPPWFELVDNGKTRAWLKSDIAGRDGMEILKHMSGWASRESKERANHISMYVSANLDPSQHPIQTDPNAGKYDYRKHPFGREHEIGFARDEIAHFLLARGIADTLRILDRERLDHIARIDAYTTTPEMWAYLLSLEFALSNDLEVDDPQVTATELQIMNSFERNADSLPLRQWPSCLPWPQGHDLPPEWASGLVMDKPELRDWAKDRESSLAGSLLLRANGHGAELHSSNPRLPSKPEPRLAHQEKAILRAIRNLGHEPSALPKRIPGKPWVKSEVFKNLQSDFSRKVFDKAWDRLRAERLVAEKA